MASETTAAVTNFNRGKKEKGPDGADGISPTALAHILSRSQGFPHNSKASVGKGSAGVFKGGYEDLLPLEV